MFWSRISCCLGLALCAGVAGAVTQPAAAQQSVTPRTAATLGTATALEPLVGRIVLRAPWNLDNLLTVPGPVGDRSVTGPRLPPVVLPITLAAMDRRDDASSAAAEGRHTLVFSTLGLIVLVAILTILLVK